MRSRYFGNTFLCNRYEANTLVRINNLLETLLGRFKKLYFCELIITTRCNLLCPSCSNLMPQLKDKAKDIDCTSIIETIDNLMNNFDVVYNLQIQGGEPFLHPDLCAIVSHILQYEGRIRNIWIMTNSMLMPTDELISLLSGTKITIASSHYACNEKRSSEIEVLLKKHNVNYRRRKFHYWHDFTFVEPLNRSFLNRKKLMSKLEKCPMGRASSLKNNKLYLCSRLANMDEVIPNCRPSGINLYGTQKAATKFLHLAFCENCAYCEYNTNANLQPGNQ